ncbi:ABC transporter ATP-binding protein [Candidatus Woesearchaeota archaeon]|nr:ABC transporter ATP-binding protein [Candidatus Woesearchaeota archaeon]MBT5271783.1 ABC transporter ATP-binding protein [Candidatus Woesearchaeota archaeon]MBT6041176.1 ABC transporter ATP-binding protein [Candidatus Woesearchaeota archaeon]MBT6336297.1 ABC transporter ATP-binding protein [Candidatus Woesearchaeota archaeon]MBT7927317.1 ABC transporter ATP-binding protein [Candidatus Woesearchaeota archaeon]
MIKISDVWKIYHVGTVDVHALRGLTLEIKEGDFVAVMGPSGSGKSTAVNMIGCLDIPSKGKIYLDGEDISLMTESDLAQIRGKKIGFVFQQFNLIPTLTALENVALPMVFQGYEKEERIKRASDLLKLVGLEERMNHRPTELSGGQQQRVAIARALSNDPQILLADEPTGNLDQKTGKEIMNLLFDLHREGKTIVMVSHDAKLAEHAKRVELLIDGKIVKSYNGKNHTK